MLKVGLTGGIASGKSTVAAIFRELGVPVIDSDALARSALEPGGGAIAAVVDAFGPAILDINGGINRAAIGEIVFRDAGRRMKLNAIVHPVVEREIGALVDSSRRAGTPIIIVDVPLLFEVGWEDRFDRIIVVYAPSDIQLARLCLRNGFSPEEAGLRLDAQWPLARKTERADIVIDNSGTPENTRRQVVSALASLRELGRSGPARE